MVPTRGAGRGRWWGVATVIPTRRCGRRGRVGGGSGAGLRCPAHLSGVEAAQPRQVQLHERPEGATDALQPEQLAQRNPVQDVRE